MSRVIEVGGYEFEGPYSLDIGSVMKFGFGCVYVVLTSSNEVVDVGETEDIKARLAKHERRGCWVLNKAAKIGFMREADVTGRERVVKEVRAQSEVPCGPRKPRTAQYEPQTPTPLPRINHGTTRKGTEGGWECWRILAEGHGHFRRFAQ